MFAGGVKKTGSPPAELAPFLPDRFAPTDEAERAEADYYARYGSGATSAG